MREGATREPPPASLGTRACAGSPGTNEAVDRTPYASRPPWHLRNAASCSPKRCESGSGVVSTLSGATRAWDYVTGAMCKAIQRSCTATPFTACSSGLSGAQSTLTAKPCTSRHGDRLCQRHAQMIKAPTLRDCELLRFCACVRSTCSRRMAPNHQTRAVSRFTVSKRREPRQSPLLAKIAHAKPLGPRRATPVCGSDLSGLRASLRPFVSWAVRRRESSDFWGFDPRQNLRDEG